MAHTEVKNTFVGVPKVTGGIWKVAQSIVLPTTAYDPRPGGAVRLGGVSDEGYTYTSERQTDKKKDWNGDKVRSIQQSKDDTFEITFIEFLNPNVMEVVYGKGNVVISPADTSHGTHISTKSLADVLDHCAYIVDTFDGKVKRRRVIPDAQPDKIDPIAEKPGDWSVYKVTFDIYPDSQGVTSYTYTELNDKLSSYGYTVDLGGATGGTFTLTHGGHTTGALAFGSTSSAVKTALVGLDDGYTTSDWDVTGSAGSLTVTVPTSSGALTGDGSSLTGGTGLVITNV